MSVNIGITDKNRSAVVRILNQILADEYVLYTKTRNYHWNVEGPQFNDLHKFFESQYEELNSVTDEIAERVRSIGGFPVSTLKEFVQLARLAEQPGAHPPARTMLANLLKDHETLIRNLRVDLSKCSDQYEDMGTSDFLTGLMEQHEKMAWMLRSFVS